MMTLVEMNVKPRCPPKCHKCCIKTEMILSPSDIARIEDLGYKRSSFTYFDGFFWRLKNVEGRCFFLREKGCIIYEYRPLGCRAYPVVYDEDEGFIADPECPASSTLSSQDLLRGAYLIRLVMKEYGFSLNQP